MSRSTNIPILTPMVAAGAFVRVPAENCRTRAGAERFAGCLEVRLAAQRGDGRERPVLTVATKAGQLSLRAAILARGEMRPTGDYGHMTLGKVIPPPRQFDVLFSALGIDLVVSLEVIFVGALQAVGSSSIEMQHFVHPIAAVPHREKYRLIALI
jgi:hypothetical protein